MGGKQINNLKPCDGESWKDLFSITAGLDDIMVSLEAGKDNAGNPKIFANAKYYGSGAITLSNYDGFPIGSKIEDYQAYNIHYKVGASTWKSSAAAT